MYIFLAEVTKILPIQTISGHDWLPTIGAVIISIVAGLGSWWQNRPKRKNDQFKVFMDESAEFRDEMRKEREILKKELIAIQIERSALHLKIVETEKQIENCNKEVRKYESSLEGAKIDIAALQEKIRILKEKKELNEIN